MDSKRKAAALIVVFVFLGVLAWLALPGMTGFGSLAEAEGKIRIGILGPLTGNAAKYGEDISKGIMLAAEEINRKGDIDGKEIELVFEDHACEPRKGVTALQSLVNVQGVKLVIDEACSSVALAEAPFAEKEGVLLLLASQSNYKIKDAGDFVFRVFPSDAFQGKELAELIWAAGHRKAAVVFINTDYGIGLREVFRKEFEALGGTVVAEEGHEMGETDFRTVVAKVKAAEPDALLFADHFKEAALAIKQAREQGIGISLFASEAVKYEEVIEIAGQAAEGLVVLYAAQPKSVRYQKFEKAYREMFGKEPATYSAYGYDSMKLLAEAVGRAGADPEKVKEEMYKVKAFEGITGTIGFDSFGERTSANYQVFVVREGKFESFE